MQQSMRSLGGSLAILASAALFAAAPVGMDLNHGLALHGALAGNGNGNNGNGKGNAGGNNAGGNGIGAGQGNGAVNGHHGNPTAQANSDDASGLGALNAVNASDEAYLNASDNSRVGKIKAYRDAINGFLGTCGSTCGTTVDITAVAAALAAASNKTLTTDTLDELNSLLGVDTNVDSNWSTDSQTIVTDASADK